MLKVFGSFVLDSTLLQDIHLINGVNLLSSLSVFCLRLCLSSLYYLSLEYFYLSVKYKLRSGQVACMVVLLCYLSNKNNLYFSFDIY